MRDEPTQPQKSFFSTLHLWVELGWLSQLDRAFVHFLHSHAPDAPEIVWLSAALVSHQLGRGHTCLDLKATLKNPDETLNLPPEKNTGDLHTITPGRLLERVSLSEWKKCLAGCPLIADGPGDTPLVVEADRLYLRRFWQYTTDVADDIIGRLTNRQRTPGNLAERLDLYFDPLRTPGEKRKEEVHWQSVAAALAMKKGFSIISGGPGTGKTTTVVYLLALLQSLALENNQPLRIRLAAPTGKAAARLTESIGKTINRLPDKLRSAVPVEVVTLHRLLGSRFGTRRFFYNAKNRLHIDLLVVDEASMIDLEMMASVLSALPLKTRLILLGDKDQLASVEAGAVLGDLSRRWDPIGYPAATAAWISEQTGYAVPQGEKAVNSLGSQITVLKKSHRFGDHSGIGALARAVNAGDARKVAAVWEKGYGDIGRIEMSDTDDRRFTRLVVDGEVVSAGAGGYRVYLDCLQEGHPGALDEDRWLKRILTAFDRFRLLSPLRKGFWGVEALNERTEMCLHRQGLLPAIGGWYSGRPVMLTRNAYSLGLMNGDTGILLPVADKSNPASLGLKAVFPLPDGSLKKVLPSRLDQVETVYAMTVHKAQGSEFDHTVLVLPDRPNPLLTRELIYTAITRSRTRFTLIGPDMALMNESVNHQVYRASGLGEMLDSRNA